MNVRPLVVGWTQTGTSHVVRGRGAQDAFLARPGPDRSSLVLAVADGAGSRERSALGARLAADIACRVLARDVPGARDEPALWRDWIRAAATAIADEFQRCAEALTPDSDAGDLATTLAAAVLRGPWAGFVAVGDCFGAVRTRSASGKSSDGDSGTWHLVLPPGRSAWLPAVSRSAVRAFALWDPDLSGILLATDGCAPLALERPEELGLPVAAGPQQASGFFDAVALGVRTGVGATALAELLSVGADGRSADDITVLCALTDGR